MIPIPTPGGAGVPPPFEIPSVSLWDYAYSAVGYWNSIGAAGGSGVNWTQMLQAMILLMLVIFGMWMIVTFFRIMSNNNKKNSGKSE